MHSFLCPPEGCRYHCPSWILNISFILWIDGIIPSQSSKRRKFLSLSSWSQVFIPLSSLRAEVHILFPLKGWRYPFCFLRTWSSLYLFLRVKGNTFHPTKVWISPLTSPQGCESLFQYFLWLEFCTSVLLKVGIPSFCPSKNWAHFPRFLWVLGSSHFALPSSGGPLLYLSIGFGSLLSSWGLGDSFLLTWNLWVLFFDLSASGFSLQPLESWLSPLSFQRFMQFLCSWGLGMPPVDLLKAGIFPSILPEAVGFILGLWDLGLPTWSVWSLGSPSLSAKGLTISPPCPWGLGISTIHSLEGWGFPSLFFQGLSISSFVFLRVGALLLSFLDGSVYPLTFSWEFGVPLSILLRARHLFFCLFKGLKFPPSLYYVLRVFLIILFRTWVPFFCLLKTKIFPFRYLEG